MTAPANFGLYIKSLRTAANLSQHELARDLGVSHVTLGEVERGKRTTLAPRHWPELVRRIGADFGVLQALATTERVATLQRRIDALQVGNLPTDGV